MIKDGESHAILHEMHIVDMWVMLAEHLLNVTHVIDHMVERIDDLLLVFDCVTVPWIEDNMIDLYASVEDL